MDNPSLRVEQSSEPHTSPEGLSEKTGAVAWLSDCRTVLDDTFDALASLPMDALGMAHDDNGQWPIRDELMANIDKVRKTVPPVSIGEEMGIRKKSPAESDQNTEHQHSRLSDPSHAAKPEWVTPLIDALAKHMWGQTHDGHFDDPYCTEDQTRLIYWGDAEAAYEFLARNLDARQEAAARALCRHTWRNDISETNLNSFVDAHWRDHLSGARVALKADAEKRQNDSGECQPPAVFAEPNLPTGMVMVPREEIIEECAKIAEAKAVEFLSPEYATGQPFSSFNERFACEQVAKAIRALSASSPTVVGEDDVQRRSSQ